MEVALRVLDVQQSQAWLKALAKDPSQIRNVLKGMGISGNPSYVPSLIRQMEKPEFARLAGESFSMITGVDFALEKIESEMPDGYEAGPNDDPEDENVEMDEDEFLPWPNVALVKQWWENNNSRFTSGARYLCGAPVSTQHCTRVLKEGKQTQRNAAALEMALSQADAVFPNTQSPGFQQTVPL
jgi:uncharacterized protein (TIGR02270 family)